MPSNIFFDYNGDFIWASIAAIVAVIGAIGSIIFSYLGYKNTKEMSRKQQELEQKKIDADIISKSRMHWIDSTKDTTSEFLTNSLRLGSLNVTYAEQNRIYRDKISKISRIKNHLKDPSLRSKSPEIYQESQDIIEHWINIGNDKFNQKMYKLQDNLNESMEENKKAYLLIVLNFSNNEENMPIIQLAKEIHEELRKLSLSITDLQNVSNSTLQSKIKEIAQIRDDNAVKVNRLAELLRDYFKKEWEKVKSGK